MMDNEDGHVWLPRESQKGKDGAESVETEIGKTNQLLDSACSLIPVILRMRTMYAFFSHLSVSRPPFFFFFLHALVGDHGMH